MFTRWRNKSGASICRYDVTNDDEDENEIFIVVVVVETRPWTMFPWSRF